MAASEASSWRFLKNSIRRLTGIETSSPMVAPPTLTYDAVFFQAGAVTGRAYGLALIAGLHDAVLYLIKIFVDHPGRNGLWRGSHHM